MSEMVECGAKAMYERKFRNQGFKWEDSTAQDEWRDLMRTAIEAMREPTEEMLDCGLNEASPGTTRDDMKEAWFAMIDAALK